MIAIGSSNRAAIAFIVVAGAAGWYACSDYSPVAPALPSSTAPSGATARGPDLRVALAAQQQHSDELLARPGVAGTAVGRLADGTPALQILLERPGVAGLPDVLDGVPVITQVTGRLMAFSDPTQRRRPAPLGFSVGHPLITAGTIGARVRDATGHVYILSNNHVLANSNGSTLGDPEYQPGPFDGGTAADRIATLSDFQAITFSSLANNTMDAAIALSTTAELDNSTPTDDGYGIPNATIFGDANGDGLFDDRSALLGLPVQKYGRTTRLTHGEITGINATVVVCYEVIGSTCTKSARYVDQLVISPGGFSNGGDSGSLIVTDDASRNPVALLFAGSPVQTIGNRIDLVLNRFGVTIDGFEPPPPGPFTDIAVLNVSAPVSVVVDSLIPVTVTVKNVGNQDVTSSFDVVLLDSVENVTVGPQTVTGLEPGEATTLTFDWTPHANGEHTLVASHTLADDRATNNRNSAIVAVNPPLTDVAVTSVTAPASVSQGKTINLSVTVANAGNQVVTGNVDVTLFDATDNVSLGAQAVSGLAVGASQSLTFTWSAETASLGPHVIVARHDLLDDDAANDERSITVTVTPRVTDATVAAIIAPPSVIQGSITNIGVTIQNVGELDIAHGLEVTLSDATAGVTIATQTVNGLAVGASAALDFPWNTTGVALNGHILIARLTTPDDKPENNARAIGITVNPPPTPSTDIAVSAINAPTSVTQGDQAIIGVTIQNTGQLAVEGTFEVLVFDQTAGATIGTQTLAGLGLGASTTLNFAWNTGSASLGNHILVASHSAADDNPGNNQRSATVTVNPRLTDIALAGITAPPSVTQGSTATIGVTVQNVGALDVTSAFDVVLTDGTAGGITIGTQSVAGLATGATAGLNFEWNTTGAAVAGHILIARQALPDGNSSNDARAIGISVTAPIVPVSDVAVTSLNAPASVVLGKTASISVTVANVGNQPQPGGFAVTLLDATDNVTLGSQPAPALAAGTSATLNFTWTASGVSLGTHTLVAAHALADDNAANNERSAAVSVTPPMADVAITTITAPATVTEGSTVTVTVTVQNAGELDVTTGFGLVLTDATAGITIGTRPVTSLPVGASMTVAFDWTTSGAAQGIHTLTAAHTLADGNAGNNQRSTVVTVNPRLTDVALTSITAPASVTQGNTATIGVTVQNVGEVPVSSFAVVLTDASTGVVIGSQAVPGLGISEVGGLTFPWNTSGATIAGHTLIARQMLADGNPANDARAIAVAINPPTIHAGNLAGQGTTSGGSWSAAVTVTIHDVNHSAVSGATVTGAWSVANGGDGECVTGGDGTCSLGFPGLAKSIKWVSFAVTGVARQGYVYRAQGNHDPDGSSNGTTIFVNRP